jgi:hypothetical protein
MDGITATRLLHLNRYKGQSDCLPMYESDSCISSQKEFHSLLSCEKERADRNGHGFSMVAIEISDPDYIPSLAKYLLKRIRSSDEIGWFDRNTLGVFLFNATANGAWQFINSSKKMSGNCFPICKYSVYSYPNEWCSF